MICKRFYVVIEPHEIAAELIVDQRIVQHALIRNGEKHSRPQQAREQTKLAFRVPF